MRYLGGVVEGTVTRPAESAVAGPPPCAAMKPRCPSQQALRGASTLTVAAAAMDAVPGHERKCSRLAAARPLARSGLAGLVGKAGEGEGRGLGSRTALADSEPSRKARCHSKPLSGMPAGAAYSA